MAVRYVQLHILGRPSPERNVRAQVKADEVSKRLGMLGVRNELPEEGGGYELQQHCSQTQRNISVMHTIISL